MVEALYLPGTDPWVHLAHEEALFDSLPHDSLALVLYVNRPCVVMGKHQNPLREVRFRELARRGWPLVRRYSGGGTVYHDEGNLNYSFLVTRGGVTKPEVLALVVRALTSLGVEVTLSAQGDLHFSGAKVSGTASQVRRDRWMVHGTLLCCADLDGLHGVLGPTGLLEEWVGVSSRPQSVRNLGLPVAEVARALMETFSAAEGNSMMALSQEPERGLSFADKAEELRSHEWTWNRTPRFRWRGHTRLGHIVAEVEDGRILSLSPAEPGDETENLSRMVGMTFFSDALFDLFA